jgi:hypothetical protein
MTTPVLSTSHPDILSFYEKNNLDFESMNLLFLDILKQIIGNLDNSLNSTLANKILEQLSLVGKKIEGISFVFDSKMNEYRKDYIHELRMILTSNNVEQIAPLIRETNNSLLDKTSLILKEVIPQTNELMNKDIQHHFQELKQSLTLETTKLFSSSLDKKSVEEFLHNIQHSVNQSNNALITLISSTESRTDRKMDEIKDIIRENNFSQLQKSVNDVLSKFDYGVGKGTMSEQLLYNILIQHYPSAEIEYVAGKKETGDILFSQKNKPKILIENKDHQSNNVPKHEVEKFIRDCDIQNCCGMILSQHRGISNKENFEIQINNGNVLLYLHNVNFDIEKISTGIEIIEHFKQKIDELGIGNSENNFIDKELLEEINQEYVYFMNQKASIIKLSKEMNEKMLEKINELKLPNLNHFLSKRFAFSSNQKDNVCRYCNEPVKKSIMQHWRYCSAKKDYEKQHGIVHDSLSDDEHKTPTESISLSISTQSRETTATTPKKTSKKKATEVVSSA